MASNNEPSKVKALCPECGKQFSQKRNLYKHTRNVHKRQPEVQIVNNFMNCPVCDKPVKNRHILFFHLPKAHDINIRFEKREFANANEFDRWKEEMEHETQSEYVLQRGAQTLANRSIKKYYHCSRSGDYEYDKQSKTNLPNSESFDSGKLKKRRRIKSQGSKRIGKLCPATLEVIYSERCVTALFWGTHIGHNFDVRHCNFSKTEGTNFAGETLTSKLKRIRESHDAGLLIAHSNITKMGDTEWNVADTSKERSYKVTKLIRPDCTNECSVICDLCAVCLHMYTCTCLDFLLHGNMCKHIHRCAIKSSDAGRLKRCLSLSNEPNNLLGSTQCPMDCSNLQNQVRERAEQIVELCDATTSFDQESLNLTIKYLDCAIKVLNPNRKCTELPAVVTEPCNNNIEKQMKRKRPLNENLLSRVKPSGEERMSMVEFLKEEEEETSLLQCLKEENSLCNYQHTSEDDSYFN